MHICATNICIWIRTLVIESLKEITLYYQHKAPTHEEGIILDTLRHHSLRHAGQVLGTHSGPDAEWEPLNLKVRENLEPVPSDSIFGRLAQSTVRSIVGAVSTVAPHLTERTFSPITSTRATRAAGGVATPSSTTTTLETTTLFKKLKKFISTTTTAATTTLGTTPTTTTLAPSTSHWETTPTEELVNRPTTTVDTLIGSILSSSTAAPTTSTTTESVISNNLFAGMENAFQTFSGLSHNDTVSENIESLDGIIPAAYSGSINTNLSCGRVSIMGPIVHDSAPYLYPFIIEYSLIGAVVIYVMWKHIGRYPKNTDEDLEHRLEIMLSRRAVVMAQQARTGRVDCVGASKGLFFGLLLLVGSLICLILFFVLIRHPQFSLLAIYLADGSHCAIMGLSVLAIFVGFIRFV